KELPGVYVRPEAKKVIPQLAERYELALAANQPPKALELLDEAGLLPFFRFKEVSETMGIAKPRPLFFRMILDTLGVRPEEAVMVGDRLDHDILPARLLGLYTIHVLLGPYRKQTPLTLFHEPHLCVADLGSLPQALVKIGS
ncbi:MAG: HAD family hydrolase, partial [Candidatus Methanomethylicaceae archaeon]